MTSEQFNEILWDYYAKNGRNTLPWRVPEPNGMYDPYKIIVSEIMLQQTQVSRVIEKYNEWLEKFPDFQALATARFADVLATWLGLGYNRRAKFLHECARQVVEMGEVPKAQAELVKLKGIGVNTAGAILAYAYNQPVVFIVTNIRTVFLHHFFAEQTEVSDTELTKVITKTIDTENPREWYWALMDYGTYLKQTVGNVSRNSKHYAKQSAFNGSSRQIRGMVLREVANKGSFTEVEIAAAIADERLATVLDNLVAEGLLSKKHGRFYAGG